MPRMIYGALAGVAATVAMTAAMRQMRARLPGAERYALPPREIIAGLGKRPRGTGRRDGDPGALGTMLAHFAYGSLTGALFALIGRRGLAEGAGYGGAVWAASYLGWIPAARLLVPATRHPALRNAMMLAAHVVWGAALAASLREIDAAERQGFRRHGEPLPDVAPTDRPRLREE